MTFTDIRLSEYEKSVLSRMVGKPLNELIHDKYIMNPTTYMSAWVVVEGKVFDIHCEMEARDYFGEREDVAVISIRESERGEIQSHLAGHALETDKVDRIISDIKIIEDTQEMIDGDEIEHAFSFTAAIIFELEGTKLMLEFNPWLSEDIRIARGPQADLKLVAAIDGIPKEEREWYRVTRKTESLRDWKTIRKR